MITEDLIAYIQAQRRKNIADDIIITRLVNAGWHNDDVQEAFRKINPPPAPTIEQPNPTQVSSPSPMPSVGPVRYVIPEVEKKPEVPTSTIPSNPTPPQKAVFSSSFSEANPKIQTPVVSTPIVPISKETHLEIRNEELIPNLIPKVASTPISISVITPILKETPTVQAPPIVPPPILTPVSNIPAPIFVPTPIPTSAPTPVTQPAQAPIVPPVSMKSPSQLSDLKMTSSNMVGPDILVSTGLPNGALLHSYKKALLSASRVNENIFKQKRNTLLKRLFIILIISVVLGSIFVLVSNYTKFSSLNFSFIKKDPKTLLIGVPAMLNELGSYKIETNANISFPPFADITTGLVSGQAINSQEVDYLSLFAEGAVNHQDQSPIVFDYKAKFLSSLFKNDIKIDLKYSDLSSYVITPDLSELLGSNAPKSNTVLIPKGQFDSFVSLLPESIQSKLNKVNIDKLISVGLPSYMDTDTSAVFKEFINSATVVEKEPDTVHGILTYHYEINSDRNITKKLLTEFVNIFTSELSSDEKNLLDETLGSVSLDSFEVWIGKEDSKIHQYRFVIKAPLSKLVGLDDKGIAGNVVSLDWKTTYYDFDIQNEISLPSDAISISSFMKSISDMKIKDAISGFKPLALSLHNALGNYGNRSNQTGSCTNPNPSSLFSPVGHTKGASSAVGAIASSINGILSITGGALSCYSTSSAWALSAPLASDPATSFCADSTGAVKTLNTPIKDTICK